MAITGIPGCTSTPAVVITPANVAFVSDVETTTTSGLTFSAPVKIVGLSARTTQFDGGSSAPYKADYRDHTSASNTNLYGSWFSWCMVVQYKDILCPGTWHVPTSNEFQQYYNAEPSGTVKSGIHGWLLGGYVLSSSTYNVGTSGNYWSSTPNGTDGAYNAYVYLSSSFSSQFYANRYVGFSLRCVR
ncbi:MAG: fibrobacter succinogenes major paralogous domain-containing protein [Dysgonamonadaceae bacterium]|nr:fibrobacter succinogenes major paralogous domain-containing protein [Dysgonamonadaceae bacterium]